MYELKIDTSTTLVSYDDCFYYTFYLYKSNNESISSSLTLTFTIPNYIQYSLPICENVINTETMLNDSTTLVSLDFSALTPDVLALSSSFTISCKFRISAPKNSIYTLTAYLNNDVYLASNVTLAINPSYTLTLSLYSPAYISCSSGDRLVYHGLLQNLGDRDITPNAIKLTINLRNNLFLTMDKNFEIVGKDISTLPLLDTISLDSSITFFNNNKGFILDLDNYTGDSYEFYFSTNLTNAASRGNKVDLSISWELNGTSMTPAYHICKVDLPIEHANHYILGPIYISPSTYLYAYTLNISGNKALPYSNLTYELNDINLSSLRIITGIYSIASTYPNENILYRISYTLTSNPDENIFIPNGEDTTFNTSVSSTIVFDNVFLNTNSIKSITLHFHRLKTGLVSISPLVLVINTPESLAEGTDFNLSGILNSNSGYSCNLVKYPGLTHDISLPKLCHISSNSLYKPGMDIDIISSIDISFDHLYDLIYYTFIPPGFKLKYENLMDNFEFTLSHEFINTSNLPVFITPSIQTIENTPLGTLIKLDFSNNVFLAGSNLTIKYKLLPLSHFSGTFTHYCLISSPVISIYTTNIGMASNILTSSIFNTIFESDLPLITSDSIYLYINNISMYTYLLEVKDNSSPFVHFPSSINTSYNSPLYSRVMINNVGNTYINSITIDSLTTNCDLLHLLLLDNYRNIVSTLNKPITTNKSINTKVLSLNNLKVSPLSTIAMLFSSLSPNTLSTSSEETFLSYNISTSFSDSFSLSSPSISSYPIGLKLATPSSYMSLEGEISSITRLQATPRSRSSNDLDDVIIFLYKVEGDLGKLKASTIVTKNLNGNYNHFSLDISEAGKYFIRFVSPNSSIYKLKVTSMRDEVFLKIHGNGFSQFFTVTDMYSPYKLSLQLKLTYGFETLKEVSNSSRGIVKNVINSQLLLNMRLEDTISSFIKK